MMTRFAGRLTPAASVDVATSTLFCRPTDTYETRGLMKQHRESRARVDEQVKRVGGIHPHQDRRAGLQNTEVRDPRDSAGRSPRRKPDE